MSIQTQERPSAAEPWERKHRLARALEYAGWEYQHMRFHLQVSDTTMTNYMHGRTKRIPISTLMAWGRVTGTRWEWLHTGEGSWLADWAPHSPPDLPFSGRGYNDSDATVVPLRQVA